MTEKDSGKRIGLLDDPNVKPVLVYPPDLIATAKEITDADHYFSSNDLTAKIGNPLFGKVTGAMVSLLTDASDWGLLVPAGRSGHGRDGVSQRAPGTGNVCCRQPAVRTGVRR